MTDEQTIHKLNDNADKYIFLLRVLDKALEMKKITKKEKKEIERRLDLAFSRNYWKLNPWIKQNPLLSKVVVSFLERYYILDF